VSSADAPLGKGAKDPPSQKLSSLMDEIKNSFTKISSVTKEELKEKARVTLVGRTSNLAEAKQLGLQNGQNDQELLADIISHEVTSWKNDLVSDCMKIAEKAHIELQSVEKGKDKILVEKEILAKNYQVVEQENRNLAEAIRRKDKELMYLLKEYENQSKEFGDLMVQVEEMKARHLNIERSMTNQLQLTKDGTSKAIFDLNERVDKLAKENESLRKSKDKIHEINNKNEECLDYQVSKLADLNLEISKLKMEAEVHRLKCHQLVNEQIQSLQAINDLNDQILSIKAENKRQNEKLIYDYEVKLKQSRDHDSAKTPEALRHTGMSSLKLDDGDFLFQQVNLDRDTDMSSFQFDNSRRPSGEKESSLVDYVNDIREKTQSVYATRMAEMQGGSGIGLVKKGEAKVFSKRQVELPKLILEDKDENMFLNGSIAEAEFRLLEGKDEEIARLNKQLIELQKNQKAIDNAKLKEAVSVLELEVRQLKEQISLLKDNEKRIVKENQNFVNKMIQEKILKVQELTIELADKENEMIMLKKKNKYQADVIKEYEKNVKDFNQKSKKR
jgi:hypothetical protein